MIRKYVRMCLMWGIVVFEDATLHVAEVARGPARCAHVNGGWNMEAWHSTVFVLKTDGMIMAHDLITCMTSS